MPHERISQFDMPLPGMSLTDLAISSYVEGVDREAAVADALASRIRVVSALQHQAWEKHVHDVVEPREAIVDQTISLLGVLQPLKLFEGCLTQGLKVPFDTHQKFLKQRSDLDHGPMVRWGFEKFIDTSDRTVLLTTYVGLSTKPSFADSTFTERQVPQAVAYLQAKDRGEAPRSELLGILPPQIKTFSQDPLPVSGTQTSGDW